MPARLFCELGELAGSYFLIDREATIGRLHENEITLHPTFISGRHARIYFDAEENAYVLEDLGSSNGTLLDGMTVTEPTRLDGLHVITFAGQFDFIFQILSEALAWRIGAGGPTLASRDEGDQTHVGDAFLPVSAPGALRPGAEDDKTSAGDAFAPMPPLADEKTADEVDKTTVGAFFGDLPSFPKQPAPEDKTYVDDAFAPVPTFTPPPVDSGDDEAVSSAQAAAPPGLFALEVIMPDDTSRVFSLHEGANVVGRELDRAVAVPDSSISRDHAQVTVREGKVFLKDLGSKNATFVDGEKLTEEVEIRPDSAISFGLSIIARLRRKAVS